MVVNFKDEDLIGRRLSSKYGYFTIIGEVSNSGKHKRFVIEFDEINNVKYRYEVTKDNILNNRVKNPYYPSMCNIAYRGDIALYGKYLEYGRWKMMINRCYNKENKDYKFYGKLGVTVCNEWLCFENYYRDFSTIDGYDEDNIKNLVLDKDIKSIDSKIYSLDTCTFVTVDRNARESDKLQHRTFLSISPIGEEFECNNQREFAKIHDLEPQGINGVLKNKQKTHKGWKFKYKEIEGDVV